MEKNLLFEEVQVFERKSVKIFLIITNIMLVTGLAISIFFQGLGNEITITLISASMIFAIIAYLVQVASLVTQVYEDCITIKFRPFFGASRNYSWKKINQLYIREYNPVLEYGGWGVKASPNGLAFTTSGNIGLQIILTDGKKILVGTNKHELLAGILMQLGKLDG